MNAHIAFRSLSEARVYLDELMRQRKLSDGRLRYLERAYSEWEAEREELEVMIDDIQLAIADHSADSRGGGHG